MSDSATFCPTCGTKVLVAPAPPPDAAACEPASPYAEPLTYGATDIDSGYYVPPSAAPRREPSERAVKAASFINKNGLWLIVAALIGAVLLLAVIVGFGARHSITTTTPTGITLTDYESIQNGTTLATVELLLGGAPTNQTPDASIVGGVDYHWINKDGSSVSVMVVNDRVVGKSESGLEAPGLKVNRSFFALLSLVGLLMGVVWFLCMTVCLYLATLVVDCGLTPVQVLIISAACAAVTALVPLGFLVALVVAFILIIKLGDTDVVDAILILIADVVLTLAVGYFMFHLAGAALGFGFRL